MGMKAPSIRGIDVNSLELDEDQKLIESVDVGIDLEYSGGFAIGIDVALAYGKTAFMSAKGKSLSVSYRFEEWMFSRFTLVPSSVSRLEGNLRLKFARLPYSHWTVAFCPPPTLEVAISSRIQGQSYGVVTDLLATLVRSKQFQIEG